jgi:hypothetical protein
MLLGKMAFCAARRFHRLKFLTITLPTDKTLNRFYSVSYVAKRVLPLSAERRIFEAFICIKYTQ